MSRWRPKFNPEHLYLITTGALNLQRVFQRAVFRRLLVDALDCTRLRLGVRLYTFVVMPNHIHVIMQFEEALPLKNFVRDYKKWTSDRIIRQIKLENNRKALMLLQTARGYAFGRKDILPNNFILSISSVRNLSIFIPTLVKIIGNCQQALRSICGLVQRSITLTNLASFPLMMCVG